MVQNAMISSELANFNVGEVALVTLPLFHSFGQTVLMNAGFYSGATLTLLPRFTPDAALGIMQRDNVSIFAGVPTMYWSIFSYPHAEEQFDMKKIADNMHTAVSGGSALPVELLRNFEARFNVPILEGYGSERDVAGCQLQRATQTPQAGLHRHSGLGGAVSVGG